MNTHAIVFFKTFIFGACSRQFEIRTDSQHGQWSPRSELSYSTGRWVWRGLWPKLIP